MNNLRKLFSLIFFTFMLCFSFMITNKSVDAATTPDKYQSYFVTSSGSRTDYLSNAATTSFSERTFYAIETKGVTDNNSAKKGSTYISGYLKKNTATDVNKFYVTGIYASKKYKGSNLATVGSSIVYNGEKVEIVLGDYGISSPTTPFYTVGLISFKDQEMIGGDSSMNLDFYGKEINTRNSGIRLNNLNIPLVTKINFASLGSYTGDSPNYVLSVNCGSLLTSSDTLVISKYAFYKGTLCAFNYSKVPNVIFDSYCFAYCDNLYSIDVTKNTTINNINVFKGDEAMNVEYNFFNTGNDSLLRANKSTYELFIKPYVEMSDLNITITDKLYDWGNAISITTGDINIAEASRLSASCAYTIKSISNNKNAGTGTVVLEGDTSSELYTDHEYSAILRGTVNVNFTIKPLSFSTSTMVVKLDKNSYYFDGTSKCPSISSVTLNGKNVASTNYTIEKPKDMITAGKKTITLKGKGNFTGVKEVTYTINPLDLNNDSMKYSIIKNVESYTYNGFIPSPILNLKFSSDGGNTWILVTNLNDSGYATYDNVLSANVGTQNIKFTGDGVNIKGSLDVPITINPLDLSTVTSDAIVILTAADSFVYNGSAHKPSITLSINSTTYSGDGFSVSYGNNINAGEGTITVTGIKQSGQTYQNIVGTLTKTFTIAQRRLDLQARSQSFTYDSKVLDTTLSSATVSSEGLVAGHRISNINITGSTADAVVNGSISLSNAVIVDSNNTVVTSNYDIHYSDGSLNIDKANLDVELTSVNCVYDGEGHSVGVSAPSDATVYYSLDNVEYTTEPIIFTNATSKTRVYVKVTKKNYNDYIDVAYVTIDKADLDVELTPINCTYDGSEHSIGVNAPEGATVYYSLNNKNFDTEPITFTDAMDNVKCYIKVTKDNYNDWLDYTTVTINKADLDVTLTPIDCTYDGETHSIGVNAPEGCKIEYSTDGLIYSETPITLVDVTDRITVYVRVTKTNYNIWFGETTVEIKKVDSNVELTPIPTVNPTDTPVPNPSEEPSVKPTSTPSIEPTSTPSIEPTSTPSSESTLTPIPTSVPTPTPVVNLPDISNTPIIIPTQIPIPTYNPVVISDSKTDKNTDNIIKLSSSKKAIKIKKLVAKKGSKVITFNLNVNKSKVVIKVKNTSYSKKVKGKKVTIKLKKNLKKGDKFIIKITRSGYKVYKKVRKVS